MSVPRPGMAEARSRGPRAWPLADRPRPGAPSNRHAVGALAACAAVCVAVIAAVMASRDVTA
ncbi:MAG TPA: hypothetical protein VFO01_14260 [Trebonia sp.]|nr:hypothetical protein [Trebonia sp.]